MYWQQLIEFLWQHNFNCVETDDVSSCYCAWPNIIATILRYLLHICLLQMQYSIHLFCCSYEVELQANTIIFPFKNMDIFTSVWLQMTAAKIVAFKESDNNNTWMRWGCCRDIVVVALYWDCEMESGCENTVLLLVSICDVKWVTMETRISRQPLRTDGNGTYTHHCGKVIVDNVNLRPIISWL